MIYAIPLLYRLSSLDSHISITRLYRALQSVIMKHNILSTALYFDNNGIAYNVNSGAIVNATLSINGILSQSISVTGATGLISP